MTDKRFQAVLAMTNQRVPRSAKKDVCSHETSVCITRER